MIWMHIHNPHKFCAFDLIWRTLISFLLFTCFISIIFAFTEFPDSTFRRVSRNFMHVSTPFVCAVIEPRSNFFITGCTGSCLISNFPKKTVFNAQNVKKGQNGGTSISAPNIEGVPSPGLQAECSDANQAITIRTDTMHGSLYEQWPFLLTGINFNSTVDK